MHRVRGRRLLRVEPLEDRLVLSGYFVDSFESGLLPHWSIPDILGHNGRVRLVSDYSVNPGGHSLAFDGTSNTGVYDLNEAILAVDLGSMTNPILTFHQLEGQLGTGWGDENHYMADYHAVTGPTRPPEALGDGLTVSNDGVHWYKIYNVLGGELNRGGDGLWQLHEYDLASEVARINSTYGAGLVLGTDFKIKFSQYDNYLLWQDGWAIDNIQITDEPRYFDTSLEPNVFHRLNLMGEDGEDYLWRVALFGDVNENTRVLVSVHGAGRGIYGCTTFWQRFVTDPANGVDDLIVVAPWYVQGGRYGSGGAGYQHLSWNHTTDAAADLVLLETLDVLAAAGVGHTDTIKLFGFSGGGQFSERFTWAHSDRVDAIVVGAPSTHTFPTTDWPYKYGIGLPSPWSPPPAGVTLELDGFLRNRIMFFVGELDNDPNHPQLERGYWSDMQGITRLERMQNMFTSTVQAAADRGISPCAYEYEIVVKAGENHDYDDPDAATFYEFLFRPPKLPGDADRDGMVDTADARILAANWGKSGMTWNDGDFNNDGLVNALDAAILASNFGVTLTRGEAMPSKPLVPVEPIVVDAGRFVGPLPLSNTPSPQQPIRAVERVGRLGALRRAYAFRPPEELLIETPLKSSTTALDIALAEEYGSAIEPTRLTKEKGFRVRLGSEYDNVLPRTGKHEMTPAVRAFVKLLLARIAELEGRVADMGAWSEELERQPKSTSTKIPPVKIVPSWPSIC